jgi:hypothetical protein
MLISRRHQLHSACPNVNMDTHIQKGRKITENEKSRYNDKFLAITILTPP